MSMQVLRQGWPEGMTADPPHRHGCHAARWVHVSEESCIGDIISAEDFVVTGVPTFYIVPGRTPYLKRFLAGIG